MSLSAFRERLRNPLQGSTGCNQTKKAISEGMYENRILQWHSQYKMTKGLVNDLPFLVSPTSFVSHTTQFISSGGLETFISGSVAVLEWKQSVPAVSDSLFFGEGITRYRISK